MIPEELEFSNEDADPCYKATDENDDVRTHAIHLFKTTKRKSFGKTYVCDCVFRSRRTHQKVVVVVLFGSHMHMYTDDD